MLPIHYDIKIVLKGKGERITYDIGVYDIGVYDIGVYDIGVYDIGVYHIGVVVF